MVFTQHQDTLCELKTQLEESVSSKKYEELLAEFSSLKSNSKKLEFELEAAKKLTHEQAQTLAS